MVKIPPSHTGNPGLIPGLGTKIPLAREQLNPCTSIEKIPHHMKSQHRRRGERDPWNDQWPRAPACLGAAPMS